MLGPEYRPGVKTICTVRRRGAFMQSFTVFTDFTGEALDRLHVQTLQGYLCQVRKSMVDIMLFSEQFLQNG